MTTEPLYTITQHKWELTDALPKSIAEQKKIQLDKLFSNLELKKVKYR